MADILAGFAQTAKDAFTGGASITGIAANAALMANGAINNFITSGIGQFKRTVLNNVLGRQQASPPAKDPGGGQKGILSNTGLGIYIVFKKNPEAIKDNVSANWTETAIQGQAMPLTTFSNRGIRVVSFDLLLDAHSSPHPLGHIGTDLDDIQMLTIPHDKSGLPIALPPLRGAGGSGRQVSQEQFGVPPLVKLVYGGRIQVGFVQSISIEELLHGTTPQAAALMLPTRARVTLNLGMIDDSRMIVSFNSHVPTGGGQGAASAGGALLTP